MRLIGCAAAIALLTACATTSPPPPQSAAFTFQGQSNAVIQADAAFARAQIESFFAQSFAEPLTINVLSDRAAFDAALPAAWGIAPTQCWMVGSGVADKLYILAPASWTTEACEHDGADAQHVQDIVTHELVHAFHGQRNPTRDFTGADEIGWFVEGLAAYVSGQLDRGRNADPAAAIAAGAAPTSLAEAWSGRYRYGVCGSLVQYIDQTYGRAILVALLADTSQAQILTRLGLSEQEFLARWQAWVEQGRRPA